jgi:hypothetical protein
LCHTAVPVKLGERTIGFLQTGQIAQDSPSVAGFEKIARQLTDWGVPMDLKSLEDAYYRCRVLTQNQYSGLLGTDPPIGNLCSTAFGHGK